MGSDSSSRAGLRLQASFFSGWQREICTGVISVDCPPFSPQLSPDARAYCPYILTSCVPGQRVLDTALTDALKLPLVPTCFLFCLCFFFFPPTLYLISGPVNQAERPNHSLVSPLSRQTSWLVLSVFPSDCLLSAPVPRLDFECTLLVLFRFSPHLDTFGPHPCISNLLFRA